MDKSHDASKSDSSSEEEWLDLSKSDYAKVIFSNMYSNSESGEVGCLFTLTETVNKNPSDYVGIYKVGYDNLSQCLAMKSLSKFKDESKAIHCGFKSEELPELNGFYQFLYVTHEKEVCGASMPFEVKQKKEVEEVVTERIENDFLMVRYGLEQKNYKLETLLKTYEAENVVLVAKIRELRGENAALIEKLEKTEFLLSSTAQELKQLKEEHLILVKELKIAIDKEASVLSVLDATEKAFDNEVKKSAEVSAEILKLRGELKTAYQSVLAKKDVSVEFEEEMKKKEVVIAESNKIIEELRAEVKRKQVFIEKIVQEITDASKAHEVSREEYNRKTDELHREVAELTADLIAKEKLLKDYRSSDREQKYSQMEIDLQSLVTKKNALEEEVARLRKCLSDYRSSDREQKYSQMEIDLRNALTKQNALEEEAARLRKYLSDHRSNEREQKYHQMEKELEHALSHENALEIEAARLRKDLSVYTSNARELEYNQMELDLCHALCQKNAFEKEATRLRKYLSNPHEYMKSSNTNLSMPATNQAPLAEEYIIEQLDDAKFMIKALEDSKQLAMREMHGLSKKLTKAKEEVSHLKCENMALKIFLEEKSSFTNLLSKLKEIDPTVDEENLESKIMNLASNAQQQTEEMNKVKEELNVLKCDNSTLKMCLEETKNNAIALAQSSKDNVSDKEENNKHSDKEIQVSPLTKEDTLKNTFAMGSDAKPKDSAEIVQQQTEEIKKLNEECKRKTVEIESLNEKINDQQRIIIDAVMNAEDKTARIVNAAELYKDLYKEKEKLAKQLRKLTLMKSRSKKASGSNSQDNSKPGFFALNIEKALTCSETTSNNSDSDTGEHVRAEILQPDLEKDEAPLPQAVVISGAEMTPYPECNSLDAAINNLCFDVKADQVYEAPTNPSLQQSLSPEEDTHIPCLICGKSFLITPHSNIPLIEHIEKEHNMDICPLCGQMFDKSFPSKYLMFHINDHFKSE